jgi:uncharacterized membrane protein
MKSKLAKEKESTAMSLSIEDILKEKYEETKETMQDLKKNKGRVRDVVRVSVDFPRNLYTRVVDETDKKEQTIRDFILTLVRQHFGD